MGRQLRRTTLSRACYRDSLQPEGFLGRGAVAGSRAGGGAKPVVERDEGLLILDDTTLDKPYANKIEHVTWHWSGKHGKAVKGINLLTLLWRGSAEEDSSSEDDSSEDDSSEEEDPEKASREPHVPCDFRLYEKDGKTKNEYFRDMLDRAAEREFAPEIVLFDSWYSGLDNLKKVRALEWTFLTRLKKNRKVNPDDSFNRRIENVPIPEDGRVLHLKGFGFVKVFRTGSTDGDAEEKTAEEKTAEDEMQKRTRRKRSSTGRPTTWR